MMWAQILLLVIGIVVVLKSADWLTNGSVGLATRLGVSQIVIGLTIVAIGTSMPEFFVSLVSAIHGTPDLAVGNIVGSNIFNALLIVGVAAAVAPITILHATVKKDIPIAVFASIMLMGMTLDDQISRIDALILFVAFLAFLFITLRGAKNGAQEAEKTKEADAVIGLTIVAGGTSLPELATSVVAARKGDSGIAIGNVLGSNVFNILMILGVTGLISPMHIQGITTIDLAVMVLSMVMLWLFSFTKYRIERWEGFVLIAVFLGYISWLIG